MPLNYTKIPKHYLHLGSMSTPSDISVFMRSKKIEFYGYEFICRGEIAKVGISTEMYREGAYGERIYRQAMFIPNAWDRQYFSGSGAEFLLVCQEFEKKYGFPITRQDTTIAVYDMSRYPIVLMNRKSYTRQLERELQEQYKLSHNGYLPVGNIKDETENKRNFDASIIESLFEAHV